MVTLIFPPMKTDQLKISGRVLGPGVNFKTAAGYGGPVWNVSLSWAGNVLLVKQASIPNANTFPTSEVRLTLARQIILKKPIPVVSNAIDKIFGKE
jgi:hypothetical protein